MEKKLIKSCKKLTIISIVKGNWCIKLKTQRNKIIIGKKNYINIKIKEEMREKDSRIYWIKSCCQLCPLQLFISDWTCISEYLQNIFTKLYYTSLSLLN